MGTLKTKVEQIVQETFPGAILRLEFTPLNEKLSGEIVWGGFAGKNQRERHQLLYGVLRAQLTPQEEQGISMILPLSPAEERAFLAYS